MSDEIVCMQKWRQAASLHIHAALNELTKDHGGLAKTNYVWLEEKYQEGVQNLGRMTVIESRRIGDDTMEVTIDFGFFLENREDPDVADCWTELGFVFNLVDGNIDLDSIAMLPLYAADSKQDIYYLAHYLQTTLQAVAFAQRELASSRSVAALIARMHANIKAEAEAVSELIAAE